MTTKHTPGSWAEFNYGALLAAFEFGYRCHEKGMNLQMATQHFHQVFAGDGVPKAALQKEKGSA